MTAVSCEVNVVVYGEAFQQATSYHLAFVASCTDCKHKCLLDTQHLDTALIQYSALKVHLAAKPLEIKTCQSI